MEVPQQPTGMLTNSYAPLMGCGVGMFDAAQLGLPQGTIVPFTRATVVSNPLQVSGYHQFLFRLGTFSSDGATQGALRVQICDPFTGVSLSEYQVGLWGIGGSGPVCTPIPFGAFTGIAPITPSWQWMVIRLALQVVAGAAGSTAMITGPTSVPVTVNRAPDLFCQTR